jgi:hypothetical protein
MVTRETPVGVDEAATVPREQPAVGNIVQIAEGVDSISHRPMMPVDVGKSPRKFGRMRMGVWACVGTSAHGLERRPEMQPTSFDPHQNPVDTHLDGYENSQSPLDGGNSTRSVLPALIGAAMVVLLIFLLLTISGPEPSNVPTSSTVPDVTTTLGI